MLALLAPPVCGACGDGLVHAGDVVCASCRAALPWLDGPRCPRCALPAPCRPCPARAAAFDRAWAPFAHEGSARQLVVALKFRGALTAADAMAAQMLAVAPAGLLDGAALVPVPAHPARRRQRGFDQAERLAAALARRSRLPLRHCLTRSAGARQVGAGRTDRLTPGRIGVRASGPAPPVAALVDDVHTTGATLDACARALRAAGSEHVVCLTYARALRR